MRSTIKEMMTYNTLLFSCFLALTLSSLSIANAVTIEPKCSYDKEKMLELSPKAFDQNYEEGWPSLVKNGECLETAADLIHTYYTKNEISTGAMRTFVWHEGQLRAEVGQYQQAIRLMQQATKPADKDSSGWNHYVHATIAFLKSDMKQLRALREELASVPKPEGFNPKDANGNPIQVDWPPNLAIVDKFILCFGQPYSEAYGGCTKETQP